MRTSMRSAQQTTDSYRAILETARAQVEMTPKLINRAFDAISKPLYPEASGQAGYRASQRVVPTRIVVRLG
jgi:hypothetical protein